MSVAERLLGVANSVIGLVPGLMKANQEKRTEMGTYFEQISKCLASVSSEIRAGEIPHGRCGELREYAREFPTRLSKAIGQEEAERLQRHLHEAHDVERYAIDLSEMTDKEPYLAKIDEAAGKFLAVANKVRVG